MKARLTDPHTSHLAGDALTVEHLTQVQAIIYRLLDTAPMTDGELLLAYNAMVYAKEAPHASESGVRSRRAELVERGLVVPTGATRKTVFGRLSIVWGVKC